MRSRTRPVTGPGSWRVDSPPQANIGLATEHRFDVLDVDMTLDGKRQALSSPVGPGDAVPGRHAARPRQAGHGRVLVEDAPTGTLAWT